MPRPQTVEHMEYDKYGNKLLWEQNGYVTKYTYDGMKRLKSIEEPSGLRTEYEFDGYGNIQREYTLTNVAIKSRNAEYIYDKL